MPFATLAEIVRHQAVTRPEWIALIFADRDTSYDATINQIRAFLLEQGIAVRAGLRTLRTRFSRYWRTEGTRSRREWLS